MIRKTGINTAVYNGATYDLDTLQIAIQKRLPQSNRMALWSSRITENRITYRNSYRLNSTRLDGKEYIEFSLVLSFDKSPIFSLTFASGTKHKAIRIAIREFIMSEVNQIEL